MKVCQNCFEDRELKSFISSSKEVGNCLVCDTTMQPLIDLNELNDFFQELINNYKLSPTGETIHSKIQSKWSFFKSHKVAITILNTVLPNLNSEISSSQSLVDYTDDILQNTGYWETLKEELKWKNRFVIDINRLIDLEWDSFFNTQFKLTNDTALYRARLHHKSGMDAFIDEDMFCPPKETVSGGRANPSGIPFLYLSDNPETVLYEVRASYLDEISIGVFSLIKTIEPIKIVDFTEDTSLFQSQYSEINRTIKAKLLREIISVDLSKPMRRYDNEIEYIPTQFICEFIKIFTGASGIRFSSSVHPAGNNFVIFNQELMECKTVNLIRVSNVSLKSITI